ncbi:hypothetical protein BASA60_001800 [Batrachochytrium salamandrivorans]|nr:hypothetical protein BASA60_001800 [Batrachochytrium salamandrivorans]
MWMAFETASPLELAAWGPSRYDQLLWMLSLGGVPIGGRIKQLKTVLRSMRLNGLALNTYASLRTQAILYARGNRYNLAVKAVDQLNALPSIIHSTMNSKGSMPPSADNSGNINTLSSLDRSASSNLDIHIIEAMIIGAVQSNSIYSTHTEAQRWFKELRNIGVTPRDIPWRIYYHMADASLTSHKVQHASKWIQMLTDHGKMHEAHPDILVWLLNRSCTLGLVRAAMMWFGQIASSGRTPPPNAFRSLIYMWISQDNINEALRVRNSMASLGVVRNAETNSILIHGLCRADRLTEAAKTANDMLKTGQPLNVRIYTGLIFACNRQGDWESAKRWLYLMQHRDCIKPTNFTVVSCMNTRYMTMDASGFRECCDMFDPDEIDCSADTLRDYSNLCQAFSISQSLLLMIAQPNFCDWTRVMANRRLIKRSGWQLPSPVYTALLDALLVSGNTPTNVDVTTLRSPTLPQSKFKSKLSRLGSTHINSGSPLQAVSDTEALFGLSRYKHMESNAAKAMLLFDDAKQFTYYKPTPFHVTTLFLMFRTLKNSKRIYEVYTIARLLGIQYSVKYLDLVLPFMVRHNAYLEFADHVVGYLPDISPPLSAKCMLDIINAFVWFDDGEGALRWALRMYRTHHLYVPEKVLVRIVALLIAEGISMSRLISRITTLGYNDAAQCVGSPPFGNNAHGSSSDSINTCVLETSGLKSPLPLNLHSAIVYLKGMQLARGIHNAINHLSQLENDEIRFSTDDLLKMAMFSIDIGNPLDGCTWSDMAVSRIPFVPISNVTSTTSAYSPSSLGESGQLMLDQAQLTRTACLYYLDRLPCSNISIDSILPDVSGDPLLQHGGSHDALLGFERASLASALLIAASRAGDARKVRQIYLDYFCRSPLIPSPSPSALLAMAHLSVTHTGVLAVLLHAIRRVMRQAYHIGMYSVVYDTVLYALAIHGYGESAYWVFQHLTQGLKLLAPTDASMNGGSSSERGQHCVYIPWKPSRDTMVALVADAARRVSRVVSQFKSPSCSKFSGDRVVERLITLLDSCENIAPVTVLPNQVLRMVVNAFRDVRHDGLVSYWESYSRKRF